MSPVERCFESVARAPASGKERGACAVDDDSGKRSAVCATAADTGDVKRTHYSRIIIFSGAAAATVAVICRAFREVHIQKCPTLIKPNTAISICRVKMWPV